MRGRGGGTAAPIQREEEGPIKRDKVQKKNSDPSNIGEKRTGSV